MILTSDVWCDVMCTKQHNEHIIFRLTTDDGVKREGLTNLTRKIATCNVFISKSSVGGAFIEALKRNAVPSLSSNQIVLDYGYNSAKMFESTSLPGIDDDEIFKGDPIYH